MFSCLVLWCKNKGKIPGVHYFQLTKSRYDVWMRALGRDPKIEHLSGKNVICCKHFSPEDVYIKGERMFLKRNAVPKWFLRRNGKGPPQERTLKEIQGFENSVEHVEPQQYYVDIGDNIPRWFIRKNDEGPSQERVDRRIKGFENTEHDITGTPQQFYVEIGNNTEEPFLENSKNSSDIEVSCTPTVEIAESSSFNFTSSFMEITKSFKRTHEESSFDNMSKEQEVKRTIREIKMRHNYSASLSNLVRKLKVADTRRTLAQKKVRKIKMEVICLKKEFTSFKQILWMLKKRKMISKNGLNYLHKSLAGVPSSSVRSTKNIEQRITKKKL